MRRQLYLMRNKAMNGIAGEYRMRQDREDDPSSPTVAVVLSPGEYVRNGWG